MVNEFPFGTSQPGKWDYLFRISVCPGNFLACLWLGALSNKGGREQRNREEIGAGATFSRSFAASPLVPARFAANFATRGFASRAPGSTKPP